MPVMNIGDVLPQVGRRWRRPKHTFVLSQQPYVIQPFFIAPVLPGETMKQLLCQSRVVSDPLKNPLIGWWLEYYFFYVKHRDLDIRDDLVAMMLDPLKTLAAHFTAADPKTYHNGGTVDWVRLCLNRVVECYFRNEDETYLQGVMDTLPMAGALGPDENWMDSLMVDASMPEADPNDVSFQGVTQQQQAWEYLRAMQMTDMTYEQYLGTYGVHVDEPGEAHKPELVRYLREWTYPTNTINPVDGKPTSAASWSIAERADKDRFFREPGFLFGVTCIRPKVYLGNQNAAAVGLMNTGMSWLPAIMKDDPSTSLKLVPTGTGPLNALTDVGGYWIDLKDILLYGDQFMNFDVTFSGVDGTNNGACNAVSIPTNAGGRRWPTTQDIEGMFAATTAKYIRSDGVVSLAILGTQQETT